MATYSKQDEIKALRALVEMDGYFADAFGSDIETIIDNINKDFAFEARTKLDCDIARLKEREKELTAKHAEEMSDICALLLCVHAATEDKRLYNKAIEKIGLDGVIRKKYSLGIALSSEEMEYLISHLK